MRMIYSYDDVLKTYGSVYKVNRAIAAGALYKVARGWYSDERHPDPSVVTCARYPRAVLTMDSAFFFYGLTDVVPTLVHVATPRNATRISSSHVRQYFMEPKLMGTGTESINHAGGVVRIFSRERMLVELLRCGRALPWGYYKELISSYRKIATRLDFREVEDCISLYERSDGLFSLLQREVL